MDQDFSRCNNDHLIIIKGHRTKRPRPPSSPVTTGEEGSGFMTSDDDDHSDETTESSIEDEIMANCLMYLAQSGGGGGGGGCVRHEQVMILDKKRVSQVVVSDDSTTEMMKGGLFVYTCKTCNKNFPSFQALGGHRASHKRPKNLVQEDKKPIFTASSHDEGIGGGGGGKLTRLSDDDDNKKNINPEFMTSHKVRNQKAKIHECSFCGSEFTSGQALGGHMRRHRNSSNAKVSSINGVETEKAIRVFQLDLNMPAPEDDHHHHHHYHQVDMKLQFNKASAASALVDCHY